MADPVPEAGGGSEGRDYLRTLADLERRFAPQADCLVYLGQIQGPNGFACPRCGEPRGWPTSRGGFIECPRCHRQTSVTAGTAFERTKKPLVLWFRAMWRITNQKSGVSALGLQQLLGLRSCQTAWAWLHKLRRAMVRPGRDQLSGEVEVDETFVGGPGPGGGHHVGGKALVAIAVEIRDPAMGGIRMRRVPDSSAKGLCGFIQAVVVLGARVQTDGFVSHLGLSALGHQHDRRVKLGSTPTEDPRLPRAHRFASLLKRWLLGTHQGRVSREHLDYYLDEFTLRLNRRRSRSRGPLFYRLVQQALLADSTPYGHLVTRHRKGKRKLLVQHELCGYPDRSIRPLRAPRESKVIHMSSCPIAS